MDFKEKIVKMIMMTKNPTQKRAIVTVVGQDTIGIVAAISNLLASFQINILDITQTTMDDIFSMIMVVDLEKSTLNIPDLSDKFKKLGTEIGQEITIYDERILQAMHRI